MTEKIERLKNQLKERINSRGLSLDGAIVSLRDDLISWGAAEEALAALDEAAQLIKDEQTRIEYISSSSSIQRKDRKPWYSGPDARSLNWNAYEKRLQDKGWTEALDGINSTSTQVVSLLNNPGESEFSGRGLVLGYVQSGKTANMTGVIAKAADAGYRLIIILTGMIEKLRIQTQARVQDDLTDLPGTSDWERWTTTEEDFAQKTFPGFNFDPAQRNLMVIKKESNTLQRLIDKLHNTVKINLNLPVLIIDDECDQASVNSPGRNDDWKAINRLIRQLMVLFPRHAYVGYTATPFANVLIDPKYDPSRPPDLYPRDFIFSLPAPNDYFGAERIFGRDLLDAEVDLADNEELDIIRSIPSEEIPLLKTQSSDAYTIPASLSTAICYFFIATAIRASRDHRAEHSTMLIHTSHLKFAHENVASAVKKQVQRLQQFLKQKDAATLTQMREILEVETGKVPPSLFGYETQTFGDLVSFIESAVADCEIVTENSISEERLDYEGSPEGVGRRYICIGGNVISRGLTLHGLVSTYFARTSRQYDTLMQMGRWFGYRHGYEDLPRVWMTREMQDNFRSLATVEADLRAVISMYEMEDHEITPLDLPVRIRQVPGLAITAKDKMNAADTVMVSFGGAHRQTTHFAHTNQRVMDANWVAGEKLFGSAGEISDAPGGSGFLIRAVPRSLIEQFLHEYQVHSTHRELVEKTTGKSLLLEYISQRKGHDPDELRYWNLGLISGPTTSSPEESFASLDINLISRSQLNPPLQNGDADIKALMSRSDILFDVENQAAGNQSWNELKKIRESQLGANTPLLLLYPINRNSQPKKLPGQRKALDAVAHVLGFGVVFPGNNAATAYVQVDYAPEYEQDLAEDDLA